MGLSHPSNFQNIYSGCFPSAVVFVPLLLPRHSLAKAPFSCFPQLMRVTKECPWSVLQGTTHQAQAVQEKNTARSGGLCRPGQSWSVAKSKWHQRAAGYFQGPLCNTFALSLTGDKEFTAEGENKWKFACSDTKISRFSQQCLYILHYDDRKFASQSSEAVAALGRGNSFHQWH